METARPTWRWPTPAAPTSLLTRLRRGERLERLRAAIAHLKPEQRQAIELARLEGLKIQEIAARLGKSPGAVKQLLARALDNLRASFGDTESLGLPDAPISTPSARRSTRR
jgi:DNA-directed RNA polymerase specialized sigma24 family protein